MKIKDGARLGFVWEGELIGPDGEVLQSGPPVCNIIPQVGINHIVALLRGTGTIIAPWYIGVGEGNFVPTSATVAADLPGSVEECVAYSEATRPVWNNSFDGVSIITSLTNRAEFTFTADKRLYTGFLVSSSTKGGNTGTLLSIARFQTPYDPPAGSVFRLGASLTLLPGA